MKHASIRELYEYWNRRRGTRPMPERGDIEPGAIRRALADTFILAADTTGRYPFRIAGTRVCAAFGRELKGSPFGDLWTAGSRAMIVDLLAVVTSELVGVVAHAGGTTNHGDALDFEMLILPLAYRSQLDVRVLGALAPRDVPYWLGIHPLGSLTLGTIRYLGPDTAGKAAANVGTEAPASPALQPAGTASRDRRGLVVHEGGQA